MDAGGGKNNQNPNIRNQMKKPTELELEFLKLLAEATDELYSYGAKESADEINNKIETAINNSKQTK